MTGKTKEEVAAEAEGWAGWGTFKPLLADAIVAHLAPIQARYNEIVADPELLQTVLADGAAAATAEADRTCVGAKRAMGFTVPGDVPKGL